MNEHSGFNTNHINVTGTNCDVGQALTKHVKDYLQKIVEKYNSTLDFKDFNVSFKKNKHHDYFVVHIVSMASKMGTITVADKDSDAYIAFNSAYRKLQNKIAKYKDKTTDSNRKLKFIEANYSVLENEEIYDENQSFKSGIDNQETSEKPLIVAEYKEKIFHFSVEEAVEYMNSNALPALLFFNTKNNKVNMVYHRLDGNIGWTDPDC